MEGHSDLFADSSRPPASRAYQTSEAFKQYLSVYTFSLACYFLLTTCPFTHIGTSRSKGLNFEKCIHKML